MDETLDKGSIRFTTEGVEIMRLDKDGMTYKGVRIEDAGEAHRAFLEVMAGMELFIPEPLSFVND